MPRSPRTVPKSAPRVAFVVAGIPMPKPRPQVTRFGNYLPKPYIAWREHVKRHAQLALAKLAEPWDATREEYAIACRFFVARRDRGDIDNLLGGVLDALNKLTWPDDRLVTEAVAFKLIDKVSPRVEVELRIVGPA